MNKEPANQKNDPLRQVLHEWRVDASLAPGFQDRVWQVIARQDPKRNGAFMDFIRGCLERVGRRPAVAFTYLVFVLSFGVAVGWVQAQHRTVSVREAMSARYVRSMNPYQTEQP